MDVLLVYCDSGAPSRYLHYLEVGLCHQVLSDAQVQVASVLLHSDRRREEILSIFGSHPARLVGFYFDEFNAGASLHFIDEFHANFPDTPVCAFGVYPALAPDKVFASKHVDFVIIGEGPVALYELAAHIIRGGDAKGIRNLWWRKDGHVERNPLRPPQQDLTLFPYPDRSLFAQEPASGPDSGRILYVNASRGCPYECLFCYSPVLKKAYEGKGNYYRVRPVPHLAGEILGELRRQSYTSMVFVDEAFPAEKSWLRGLAQKIGAGNSVPFQAALCAEDCGPEVLDLLKAAGCASIVLGIETGSEAFRKRIAARNLSNERVQSAVAAARERSIQVVAGFMAGMPLESEALLQETYTMAQALSPDEVRCTVYQPIERTSMQQYARDKAYVPDSEATVLPDFTQLGLRLPELSPDSVRKFLYSMHFLNLRNKLRSLPPLSGYFDFVQELPKAKFRMKHSGAVDAGLARLDGQPFPYISVETGSDCRFGLKLREHSVLRFSLFIPGASVKRLEHNAGRIVAEVFWVKDRAEQPVFYRAFSPAESDVAQKWHECIVQLPNDKQAGELLFRVSCAPAPDTKASVLWGMLTLYDQEAFLREDPSAQAAYADYESKLAARDAEIGSLREQLLRTHESELSARQEAEQKTRRIAELHVRVLELEKALHEKSQDGAAEQESGLSGRIKNIFKK